MGRTMQHCATCLAKWHLIENVENRKATKVPWARTTRKGTVLCGWCAAEHDSQEAMEQADIESRRFAGIEL